MPRKRRIDPLSDFERAAERLPREMAEDLRDRQRDVVNKRERAEVNDELRRLHVRGRRNQDK
jgi:hypothetical protein